MGTWNLFASGQFIEAFSFHPFWFVWKFRWKHTMLTPFGMSHCTFFWMVIFEPKPCQNYKRFFIVFLHIIITHNPPKKEKKIIIFSFILWWSKLYFHDKNTCNNIFKNANILQKWLKWFLTFMKFILVISHVISHNLNQICEPFENFHNFHVINGFFLQS
jgi:hypothetical protein